MGTDVPGDGSAAPWFAFGRVEGGAVVTGAVNIDLEPVTLVDIDGQPTAEARYSRARPDETLSWLYETMVVTRDLDTEFVNLQRQGELALYASCLGQEAAQIGAAAPL